MYLFFSRIRRLSFSARAAATACRRAGRADNPRDRRARRPNPPETRPRESMRRGRSARFYRVRRQAAHGALVPVLTQNRKRQEKPARDAEGKSVPGIRYLHLALPVHRLRGNPSGKKKIRESFRPRAGRRVQVRMVLASTKMTRMASTKRMPSSSRAWTPAS